MPNFLATLLPLLAQAQGKEDKQKSLTNVSPSDVSREINKGIEHDLPWELLLVGIGATLIAITAVTLRRKWIHRQKNPGPLVLFSAIARKAGLTLADRFVLWRIANACDLPNPIALLLARGTLRHHATRYAARKSGIARERLSLRLKRIEAELFG